MMEVFTVGVFICVISQGLSQMRKVAQVGLDGVWRTDWHDYEAMRRDAARAGTSKLFCFGLGMPHTHTHTHIFIHKEHTNI